MDLRLTFNEVPTEYDNLRPQYADALSDDIIQFSSVDKTKKALEIGIGTGKATLPFLKTGCELTAIELGDKLAQYSKEKFAKYENLKILNQDFESVLLEENSYDLIYSASAFHWIQPEAGMQKVSCLLKPGGVFAWLSVQPAPTDENIHNELQKVYREYERYFKGNVPEFNRQPETEEKQLYRANLLRKYGFVDVREDLYSGTRTLNAKEYATLCSTYSDHRAIPEEDRIQFLQKIENAINHCGGEFIFDDTFLLCMGKKSI
jgi:Dimethyladenosine transferase (rRNA methylation)